MSLSLHVWSVKTDKPLNGFGSAEKQVELLLVIIVDTSLGKAPYTNDAPTLFTAAIPDFEVTFKKL